MNSMELKTAIDELRLSQAEFARLVGVSVGAVSQWLSGARGIPGPVDAYLGLFMRLPVASREYELSQLRKGTSTMRDGMYLIDFYGTDAHNSQDSGQATLTIENGRAYGFDSAGAMYDGTVIPAPEGNGVVVVEIKVRMPPNTPSVVGGTSHPFEWILPVSAKLNLLQDHGYALVDTGLGPRLNATFTRMRGLPLAA